MPHTIHPFEVPQASEPYDIDGLLEVFGEGVEGVEMERLIVTEPSVIASCMQRLNVEDSRSVLRPLPEEFVGQVLSLMDGEGAAEILSQMREWRALKVLSSLQLDDATDVVSELSEADRVCLLGKLSEDIAEEVRKLLAYDPDTAGGVMTPTFASVSEEMSVDEAIAHIRKIQEDIKHTSYIYVLDRLGVLLGVFSIRSLILARHGALVKDIMESDLKGVLRSDEDRETVAQTMADLHLHTLPVVDNRGRMLGVVEYDDAIGILQSEATEDIQRLVGAGPDEGIHDDLSYSIQRRCPWLAVNMLTAFVSAYVITLFHEQIESLSLLAALMPVVASLGGNTGSQALAVIIRSLATGDMQTFDKSRVCFKELTKGFLQGLMMGALSAGIAYWMSDSVMMAVVLMGSMVFTMAFAGLLGAFIPLMLKRFGFDPAQSASIFLTASTDVFGFLVFLSLGSWLLL